MRKKTAESKPPGKPPRRKWTANDFCDAVIEDIQSKTGLDRNNAARFYLGRPLVAAGLIRSAMSDDELWLRFKVAVVDSIFDVYGDKFVPALRQYRASLDNTLLGVAARQQKSSALNANITKKWHELGSQKNPKAEHSRAAIIAKTLKVSVQRVRRVTSTMKTKKRN